jgi:hypothetical protein
MDTMNIAQMSTALAGANTANAVDISLLKKSQDIAASQMQQLIGGLPSAPGVGESVDVSA